MLQRFRRRIYSTQTAGICLLFLLISRSGFTQSSFSFLNIPGNARLSALGGVNVSLSDRDVNFFASNPALNSDSLIGFASLSYQAYLAKNSQTSLCYQPSMKKIGSLTVGIQHMDYGSIARYDASGAAMGTFTSGETALLAGKSFQSGNFRMGANLKGIFSNLAGYRSSALAMDMGGVFIHPKQRLTVGIAVKNLGVLLSDYSETSNSKLPFDVQLGTTFKPEHMPIRFSLTAFGLTAYNVFSSDENDRPSTVDKIVRHINAGAELLFSKHLNLLVAYNFRNRQDLKLQQRSGGAGISLGMSLKIKTMEFIFSRGSYGPQQATYAFTLNANTTTLIRKRSKI